MSSTRRAVVCSMCRGAEAESDIIKLDGTIYRNSLGRQGVLGELYDARTDTLTKTNMLSGDTPKSAVRTLLSPPNVSTQLILDHERGQQQRLPKLDVNGEIKLSLMLGLVKPEGSATYLNESKSITHTRITGFIAFTIVTKRDILRVNHADLKELVEPGMLRSSKATHVVSGIKWGISGGVEFEQELGIHRANDVDFKRTAAATLELVMKNAAQKLVDVIASPPNSVCQSSEGPPISGCVQYLLVGDIDQFNFDMKFEINDIPGLQELFTGSVHDSMINIAEAISIQLNSFNNGKGRPLEFTAFSIDSLAKLYLKDGVRGHVMNSLSLSVRLSLEQELGEFAKQRQALRWLRDYVLNDSRNGSGSYGQAHKLTGTEVAEIIARLAEVEKLELDFQREMRNCVLEFRSGRKDEVAVRSALASFRQENQLWATHVSSFVEEKRKYLSI